jgi:hypothetical protein
VRVARLTGSDERAFAGRDVSVAARARAGDAFAIEP